LLSDLDARYLRLSSSTPQSINSDLNIAGNVVFTGTVRLPVTGEPPGIAANTPGLIWYNFVTNKIDYSGSNPTGGGQILGLTPTTP
jgi:hypothetical protein